VLTLRTCIEALRPICEVVFDLLLRGYTSNLKAHYNIAVEGGMSRESTDKWKDAISAADKALDDFRLAETKRKYQLTDEANSIAEEAMTSLKKRYGILIFGSNKSKSNLCHSM
jgi:hypothetical protein